MQSPRSLAYVHFCALGSVSRVNAVFFSCRVRHIKIKYKAAHRINCDANHQQAINYESSKYEAKQETPIQSLQFHSRVL